MSTDLVIVRLDAARIALREAKTIQDKKKMMDVGDALKLFAKRQNASEEVKKDAHHFFMDTVRLFGEAMLAQPKAIGGQPYQEKSTGNLVLPVESRVPTLEDLGVSKTVSAASQILASMQPEEYEAIVEANFTLNEAVKEVRAQKKKEERKVLADSVTGAEKSDRWKMHHTDMSAWKAGRQFDWIITDPPYPKQYLTLYEQLAIRANDWLKEGGLLVAMCGQSCLDEIYTMLAKHLYYYWTAAYLTPGQSASLRQVNVNTGWKPLLIFAKGKYTGKIFGDVFKSGENDKTMHKWGQSESGMFDVVSKLVLPGQSILDPFCGAGTTGVAALRHGCLFEGVELEEENYKISIARLNAE